MLPAQPNLSLVDGLACLQALASSREPVGSRELARLLGLEPTRTNRLLKTLAYLGLAQQGANRKYRTGPAIHVLGAQTLFGSGLLQHALGPLEELRDTGLIVALGVLWRDQTCYLYHAAPESTMAQGLGHYRIFPATSSGIGMALLAHKSDEDVRGLFEHDGDPHETLPDLDGPAGLLSRLDKIRRDGHSLIPVPDSDRRTLAVTVGSPTYAAVGLSGRFADSDVPRLLAALKDAVDHIQLKEEVR